ncbi:MAG: prolyl oligopeptidase family serine peptidase [Firmicutes bacterium]|nr:prolyl oligopeptidase family serine peptidase [Bacillota bacterium]
MDSLSQIDGIPVVARTDALDGRAPAIIVIHGMNTTAASMRAGWPDDEQADEQFHLCRIYWQVPILRGGREDLARRRQGDLFRELFWPVVSTARAELERLVNAVHERTRRPVGLFGFSIGGLISLWGAVDNRPVHAAVAVGGVPHLDYLLHFYPDYDWNQEDVVAQRASVDLTAHPDALKDKATLILHGLADDQARWDWMESFARAMAARNPGDHEYETFANVQHRLQGQTPQEEAELVALRARASRFLAERLAL